MPCKCAGFKAETCSCKILAAGFHPNVEDNRGLTLLSHSKSACRLQEVNNKTNFMLALIEALYEKCAAYNLRYCPIRGYTKHDSYLWSAMKDVVILACFMLANFVVFLAIFTKTMVHIYQVVVLLAHWMSQTLKTKLNAQKSSLKRLTSLQDDYIQSTSHNFR